MSDTYTKLFSSITESTIWGEAYSTRIVWVTMLAMVDASGMVYGTVPGLARRANVTREECDAALASFLAPDPDSRTPENEGRRIEKADGGWMLINHAKYAAVRDEAERREYKRQWDKENRANRPNASHRTPDLPPTTPDSSDTNPTNPTLPTPPALTPTLEKKIKNTCAEPSDDDSPPVAYLPLNTGREFAITARQVAELVQLYPAADVPQELRNMRGWCISHTERRKTKKGVMRFVHSWLSKAQNDSGGRGNATATHRESAAQRVARINTEAEAREARERTGAIHSTG